MKSKMSTRRAAEECKELKSILSDNRVNTSFAKNRNRLCSYNRWSPYVDDSTCSSSKCLKRAKDCWKVDKQKKFKFDFPKKSDVEIANQKPGVSRLHDNRSREFYTPIPGRNEVTAIDFDYGLAASAGPGPPIHRYPNESETESLCSKMGDFPDFYFLNDKTVTNDSSRVPDCNYTSTGSYIPRHLVSTSSSSSSSSSLAANLYGDCGSPNDYHPYYNYYYHHQQQQPPHQLNTPSVAGKNVGSAWDYFEPQFNSISHFYHKSFPPFDWYQYSDQWQGWTDQYAQGEGGHYSYPFCYAQPSCGTSSILQKGLEFPRIESENSIRNQMLKHLPNKHGNPMDIDSTREVELQNQQRLPEKAAEVGSTSSDFKEAFSPTASHSSSPPSFCSSSSPSLKSRDVDSTGSPGRSYYQSLGRKGAIDPKTCTSHWGGKGCPHNWLAVDKTLVEDLIDNIMTGNKSNAVDNSGSGLSSDDTRFGSGNCEGTRLAVL